MNNLSRDKGKLFGSGMIVALALVLSLLGVQLGGCAASGGSSAGEATATAATEESSSVALVTSDQKVADAREGKLAFRNLERLMDHYERHGLNMGFDSMESYVAAANVVVANPDSLHRSSSKQVGDDCYFLRSSGEFVVVSGHGCIRTYYITNEKYFERQ